MSQVKENKMLFHIYFTFKDTPLTLTLEKNIDYTDDSTIAEMKQVIQNNIGMSYDFEVQNMNISLHNESLDDSVLMKDIDSVETDVFECSIIHSTRKRLRFDDSEEFEDVHEHYSCIKMNIGNIECNARLRNGLKPTFRDLQKLNSQILNAKMDEIDEKWILI